jgi:hypothetical protein
MSQQVVDNMQHAANEDASVQRSPSPGTERGPEGESSGDVRAGTGRAGPVEAGAAMAGDATLRALDALSQALEEVSEDQKLLGQRLVELRRQRMQGRPWREILAAEEPPGTMQVVSHMLASLARASGTLRKELVETLRREAVSIPAIARLFGVTHQRVSNLLRRPSE